MTYQPVALARARLKEGRHVSTSPISGTTASLTSGATTNPSSGTDSVLSSDAFLKLLTTQLQNQDPLEPGQQFRFHIATSPTVVAARHAAAQYKFHQPVDAAADDSRSQSDRSQRGLQRQQWHAHPGHGDGCELAEQPTAVIGRRKHSAARSSTGLYAMKDEG